jgi:hypothetical protein
MEADNGPSMPAAPAPDPAPQPGQVAAPTPAEAAGQEPQAQHPHDFDAQKRLHRQIRNDPDYDDWEYGTEPLPHEAWLKPTTSA